MLVNSETRLGCAGVRGGGAVAAGGGVDCAGYGGEGGEREAVQGEAAGPAVLEADPVRGSPDQCRQAAALEGTPVIRVTALVAYLNFLVASLFCL